MEADRHAIVRAVHDEWVASGKLHDPPDNGAADDDLEFWAEVDRRMRRAEHAHLAEKHRHLLDYLTDK